EAEMAEVRRLIRLMRLPAGLTRSRRARPGGRDRLDIRRLLRRSMRFGGELLVFSWKSPRLRPRPLVLLCDISGSMERYARLLLNFAYALKNASTRVEAFVFATRLTRITRLLRSHDIDAALNRETASVDDWSGGTRIGEAIETFNRRYARRVLGHGATVALISDGWDRGDAAQMRRAIARLQRSCHRLIWMNPLMGAPGYEPLTLGLQAALPFVDDFLPAHNLANLEALGALLLETASRRPVRRQTPVDRAPARRLQQQRTERLEIGKVVRRQEIVDKGQRRLQAQRQRFVAGRAHQRVHPDQAVAGALQPRDSSPHLGGVTPVPAITDQGHGGAVSQHPPRVAAIECLDRFTDASPARPVVDRGGHPVEGRVDVMRTEQARDASQAGGENEGLHPGTGVLEGVGEIQQQPCVPLHRTADVAEQHQWTRANGRALPAKDQQLAAKSQATPQ